MASAVNTHLTLFYWQIGRRIREDILQGKRAGYGKEILQTLSAICCEVWERILGQASPAHVSSRSYFPDEEIVSGLRRQLSWTHFKLIIYLDDTLKCDQRFQFAKA